MKASSECKYVFYIISNIYLVEIHVNITLFTYNISLQDVSIFIYNKSAQVIELTNHLFIALSILFYSIHSCQKSIFRIVVHQDSRGYTLSPFSSKAFAGNL